MDEVESESAFSSEQQNTAESDYHFINSMASGVGALIAGTILIILLCVKSYKSLFQRIFMFIVLLVLLKHVCKITTLESCDNEALVCVFYNLVQLEY